jgi:Raf kinase inhibitor-like YbhB/YbcL family protein
MEKSASESLAAAVLAWALLLGLPGPAAAEEVAMDFALSSPSFGPGDAIPVRHTCEGSDLSPTLEWSGVPPGTESLALIVDDPDAPDPKAPRMTWVHWVLYNIPPTVTSLGEGLEPRDLPQGTLEGVNDWKRTGYGGPCPPIGRHRYFHKLYALDVTLDDLGNPTKEDLLQAAEGHILGRVELMGTYQKGQ